MRKSSDDIGWTEVAIINGKTKYIDTDVEIGNEYTSSIRCLDKKGEHYVSGFDAQGKSMFICESPLLDDIQIEDGKIQVSWKNVEGAEKYRIYIKIDSAEKYKGIETISSTNTSYIYSDISTGHRYTFTVRCLSDDESMYVSMYNQDGISIDY